MQHLLRRVIHLGGLEARDAAGLNAYLQDPERTWKQRLVSNVREGSTQDSRRIREEKETMRQQ